MTSGIYIIRVADHYYYGQTQDLRGRNTRHLWDLTKGKHYNRQMQRAYDKHGSYSFTPLLICEMDELNRYEQWFLDQHTGHIKCANVATCAEASRRGGKWTAEQRENHLRSRGPMSEEQKQKISEALTGREFSSEAREKMAAKKRRAVRVLRSTGETERYGSVSEAARELGVSRQLVTGWLRKTAPLKRKYEITQIEYA